MSIQLSLSAFVKRLHPPACALLHSALIAHDRSLPQNQADVLLNLFSELAAQEWQTKCRQNFPMQKVLA